MTALVHESSSIWRVPEPAARLARLVSTVPVVRMTYAEIEQAAGELLRYRESAVAASADHDHLPWPGSSSALAPFIDAIAVDTEDVVLAEETCTRIGGAAAAAFVLAYDHPESGIDDLVALGVRESGLSADAVRGAYDVLAEQGLLVRSAS